MGHLGPRCSHRVLGTDLPGPSPYVLVADKTQPSPMLIGPALADPNFTTLSCSKATSATPGYFSSYKISNRKYVDFSVESSNPSLHFFRNEYKTPAAGSGVFVSFGVGTDLAQQFPPFRPQNLRKGVKATLHKRYVLESAHHTHGVMHDLLSSPVSNWAYCRFNPNFLTGMHEHNAGVLKTWRHLTRVWLRGDPDFLNLVAYLRAHRLTTVPPGLGQNLAALLQLERPWLHPSFAQDCATILSNLNFEVRSDDDVPYYARLLERIVAEQGDRILETMLQDALFATWFDGQTWLGDHQVAVALQNALPPHVLLEFQNTYAAEMVATYAHCQMDSPLIAGDMIKEHYDARGGDFFQTMNAAIGRAWEFQSNVKDSKRIRIKIEEYGEKLGVRRAFKYIKDAVRMKFLYATTQDLKDDLKDFVNRGVANTAMLVADHRKYQVLEIKPNLDPQRSSLYNVNVVVGIKSVLGGGLLMGEVQFVAWPALGPGLEHLEYLRAQQHFLYEIDRMPVKTRADFLNEVGRAMRALSRWRTIPPG